MTESGLQRQDLAVTLISLRRAELRRRKAVAELDQTGLSYTIFDAIDGREQQQDLLRRADPLAYARNMGSPILAGELGVYASHIAVWQKLIESGRPAALIFEDDIVIGPRFDEALNAALRGAQHWDLVRFSAVRAKIPVCQGLLGEFKLNAYVGPFTGNAAYLIKKDVAARLLKNLWPQTRALDHELNRFFLHDYRQFGLEPLSVTTDDGQDSTITRRDFAGVGKFTTRRRLPYYRLKAANYFRRAFWLARKGRLWPSSRKLDLS